MKLTVRRKTGDPEIPTVPEIFVVDDDFKPDQALCPGCGSEVVDSTPNPGTVYTGRGQDVRYHVEFRCGAPGFVSYYCSPEDEFVIEGGC